MPECHTFVSYFWVFQMSAILPVFGQQLWNMAVLLILTYSFSWWGSFLWLMKFNLNANLQLPYLHKVYSEAICLLIIYLWRSWFGLKWNVITYWTEVELQIWLALQINNILYILLLQVVNKYIDQGVAELVPGVLFIDEVCYIKLFTFFCVCVVYILVVEWL